MAMPSSPSVPPRPAPRRRLSPLVVWAAAAFFIPNGMALAALAGYALEGRTGLVKGVLAVAIAAVALAAVLGQRQDLRALLMGMTVAVGGVLALLLWGHRGATVALVSLLLVEAAAWRGFASSPWSRLLSTLAIVAVGGLLAAAVAQAGGTGDPWTLLVAVPVATFLVLAVLSPGAAAQPWPWRMLAALALAVTLTLAGHAAAGLHGLVAACSAGLLVALQANFDDLDRLLVDGFVPYVRGALLVVLAGALGMTVHPWWGTLGFALGVAAVVLVLDALAQPPGQRHDLALAFGVAATILTPAALLGVLSPYVFAGGLVVAVLGGLVSLAREEAPPPGGASRPPPDIDYIVRVYQRAERRGMRWARGVVRTDPYTGTSWIPFRLSLAPRWPRGPAQPLAVLRRRWLVGAAITAIAGPVVYAVALLLLYAWLPQAVDTWVQRTLGVTNLAAWLLPGVDDFVADFEAHGDFDDMQMARNVMAFGWVMAMGGMAIAIPTYIAVATRQVMRRYDRTTPIDARMWACALLFPACTAVAAIPAFQDGGADGFSSFATFIIGGMVPSFFAISALAALYTIARVLRG